MESKVYKRLPNANFWALIPINFSAIYLVNYYLIKINWFLAIPMGISLFAIESYFWFKNMQVVISDEGIKIGKRFFKTNQISEVGLGLAVGGGLEFYIHYHINIEVLTLP